MRKQLKYFILAGFAISFILSIYPVVIYPYHVRRKSRSRKLLITPGTPRITIIVPVFNEENFIRKKIENIRESNYPQEKISIIIVDNSSTDSTGAIADSLDVRVLHSRRGKVFAINEALEHLPEATEKITKTEKSKN